MVVSSFQLFDCHAFRFLTCRYVNWFMGLHGRYTIIFFFYHLSIIYPSLITHYCLCQQPDCLDDLSFAIMSEMSKMCYRVSDDDVTRARNQVYSSLFYSLIFSLNSYLIVVPQLLIWAKLYKEFNLHLNGIFSIICVRCIKKLGNHRAKMLTGMQASLKTICFLTLVEVCRLIAYKFQEVGEIVDIDSLIILVLEISHN